MTKHFKFYIILLLSISTFSKSHAVKRTHSNNDFIILNCLESVESSKINQSLSKNCKKLASCESGIQCFIRASDDLSFDFSNLEPNEIEACAALCPESQNQN